MALSRFDPPANWPEDLTTEALRQAWSDQVSGMLDSLGKAFVQQFLKGQPGQFFNELTDNLDQSDRAEAPILWQGFPKSVERDHGEGSPASWSTAEDDSPAAVARQKFQDEYLEWHVTRDPATRKIVRVELTCEGPEYWQFLAASDPNLVLHLYQKYVSGSVTLQDLFPNGGSYDPLNKWNTGSGAMHLIQRNNTLEAEVNIAAAATILRNDGQGPITDPNDLIQCARFGQASRASDPHIGDVVNQLARQGYTITLKNPIGLYIDGIDDSGFNKPDHTPATGYLKIVRGIPGQGLRAIYEVPAGETAAGQPFVVGDMNIGGTAIDFGGQIAKRISMKLTGVAVGKGKTVSPEFPCGDPPAPAAGLLALDAARPFKFASRLR